MNIKSKQMLHDVHQENVNSESNHKKKVQPKDKLDQSNPMCFTIEKKSKAISAELTKKCLFFFFSSFHTWGFASWWAYGAVSSSEFGLTWLQLWSIILGYPKLDVKCGADNQRTTFVNPRI